MTSAIGLQVMHENPSVTCGKPDAERCFRIVNLWQPAKLRSSEPNATSTYWSLSSPYSTPPTEMSTTRKIPNMVECKPGMENRGISDTDQYDCPHVISRIAISRSAHAKITALNFPRTNLKNPQGWVVQSLARSSQAKIPNYRRTLAGNKQEEPRSRRLLIVWAAQSSGNSCLSSSRKIWGLPAGGSSSIVKTLLIRCPQSIFDDSEKVSPR